jgi:microtubule-associated protein-like 1/2
VLQTLQDELTGAAFHPLDDNLLITHGKGHLTFWTRRKDGFFERTDIIKPVSRTATVALSVRTNSDSVIKVQNTLENNHGTLL